MEPNIQIDESTHQRIPPVKERLKNAVFAACLGFVLLQIVGFWIFPGIGFATLYVTPHPAFSIAGKVVNVYMIAFLAVFALMGWFKGPSFLRRLKDYIAYWKFW